MYVICNRTKVSVDNNMKHDILLIIIYDNLMTMGGYDVYEEVNGWKRDG